MAAEETSSDENTVDAEFEEVKERRKDKQCHRETIMRS